MILECCSYMGFNDGEYELSPLTEVISYIEDDPSGFRWYNFIQMYIK